MGWVLITLILIPAVMISIFWDEIEGEDDKRRGRKK
jgi:hypothetical protein